MSFSKSEKKKYCSDCCQDYYNHGNNSTTGECWSLSSAKLITAYRIGWWVPIDKASNFTEVKVLSCYNDLEYGHGNAYLRDIPSHLKLEWNRLKKERKSVT